VGSNPTQGIDVCVRLFCVCVFVLFCVQVTALRRDDLPSKEFYRLWIPEKAVKVQQMDVDRQTDRQTDRQIDRETDR
jgi:hypothetical protein